MIFVESSGDLKKAIDILNTGECVLQVVDDKDIHPANNRPVLVIAHHIQTHQTVVISVSHPDCVNVGLSILNIIQRSIFLNFNM